MKIRFILIQVMVRIIRLTRYAEKGLSGETLESASLLAGLGMEGDFHARGGERQLSLLCLETKQWMDAQASIEGLCLGRYKENILLDGMAPADLVPGKRFKIGEAILEISDAPKGCFPECPLFSGGCLLAGQYLFATIVRGGIVKTGATMESAGDPIEKEKP